MARRSAQPTPVPGADGLELGLEFLRARRAQNLTWMSVVEQSLRTLGDLQKVAGTGGVSLAKLSTAQAGFVRETANVYRSLTSHLAR
jgi:hypothetical protein